MGPPRSFLSCYHFNAKTTDYSVAMITHYVTTVQIAFQKPVLLIPAFFFKLLKKLFNFCGWHKREEYLQGQVARNGRVVQFPSCEPNKFISRAKNC